MIEFLLVLGLVLVVVFVLVLPWWLGRRRRHLTSRLTHYQAVAEALLENDLTRAREGLKEIVRTDTEDVAAYLRLAHVLRREGDHERAAALYRNLRAREIADHKLRLQITAGWVGELFALGQFEEARVAAEELRRLDRRHPLIARVELQDALRARDYGRALKACDQLSKVGPVPGGPPPAAARTHVAAQLMEAGQPRDARRALEQAVAEDGGYAPGLFWLGEAYNRQNDFEKAAQTWTLLLRKAPASAAGVVDQIEKVYFEMGRFSELGNLYDELAAQPDSAPVLRLASARMALRRGEIEEGLAKVEELLARDPSLPGAHEWRAFLLLEAQRPEEARRCLKERVESRVTTAAGRPCPSCARILPWTTIQCPHCGTWQEAPFIDK